MTNLERVLIVDDTAVKDLQAQANIPTLAWCGRGDWEEYSQRAADIADEMEGKTAFNLTESYRNAGGDKDKEILVAAQPKLSVSQNFLYENTQWEDIAQHAIDYDQAITDIEQVNPDKTLLDIQFGAPMSEELREEYVRREKAAESFQTQVTFPEGMSDGKLDYVGPMPGPKFPTHEGPHDEPVADNPERREDQLFSAPQGSSPVHAGGVILGYHMKKEGKDFIFWTSDTGHSVDGIRSAYVLGLLTKENIQSLYRENMKLPPGSAQREDIREEDVQKYGVRNHQAMMSDEQNIIAYEKNLIDIEADAGSDNRLSNGAVSRLNEVIALAEGYQ